MTKPKIINTNSLNLLIVCRLLYRKGNKETRMSERARITLPTYSQATRFNQKQTKISRMAPHTSLWTIDPSVQVYLQAQLSLQGRSLAVKLPFQPSYYFICINKGSKKPHRILIQLTQGHTEPHTEHALLFFLPIKIAQL